VVQGDTERIVAGIVAEVADTAEVVVVAGIAAVAEVADTAEAAVPLVAAPLVVAEVGHYLMLQFRNYRKIRLLQPDYRNLNKMSLIKPLPFK
jgi:hypothetical protein